MPMADEIRVPQMKYCSANALSPAPQELSQRASQDGVGFADGFRRDRFSLRLGHSSALTATGSHSLPNCRFATSDEISQNTPLINFEKMEKSDFALRQLTFVEQRETACKRGGASATQDIGGFIPTISN